MNLLPDDVFKHHIMQYLSIHDVVLFDNACLNHTDRKEFLNKVKDVILIGDMKIGLRLNIIHWLQKRSIYLQSINLVYDNDWNYYTMNSIEIGTLYNMLKYCEIITISHNCVLDAVVQGIASQRSCQTRLMSLTIDYEIEDVALISISELCIGLNTLQLNRKNKVTDTSIISIATHCTGLQSLKVSFCSKLTDTSIISISTHCSGLQSLDVHSCEKLTDASIISLSTHCTRLQSLDGSYVKLYMRN